MGATAESYRRVPETCPKVDTAIDEYIEAVVENAQDEAQEMIGNLIQNALDKYRSELFSAIQMNTNYLFREELVAAIRERQSETAELEAAGMKISSLEDDFASLEAENSQLRARIDELEAACQMMAA